MMGSMRPPARLRPDEKRISRAVFIGRDLPEGEDRARASELYRSVPVVIAGRREAA